MIIVDLEMSGTDSKKCGIIEIGAVDFDNPKNQFNQIAKLSNDEIVYNDPTCSKPVLEVLGKTEEELRNPKLKSQKQLLENFFKWTKSCKDKVLACQQCLDIQFLRAKCKKYKLEIPDPRYLDIGSLAQGIYYKLNKKIFLNDKKIHGLGNKGMCKFCLGNEIEISHTALEDAKLEAELLSRILNGKNMFEEYSKFPVPEYLKKFKENLK